MQTTRERSPKEAGMKAEKKDGLLRTSPGALAFGVMVRLGAGARHWSDGQVGDR